MKTRSNMPLFVVECTDIKALSNSQIDLLRCGDYLVKKDASGEHAYKVTYKSDTGICLTYHDASVVETQSYDKVDGDWVYNSEDKSVLPVNGDAPYFEDITDKDGHNMFIGEAFNGKVIEGVEYTYSYWSLSGTHLMIVLAFKIEDETTWVGGAGISANIELPKWILDKIYPTAEASGYIEYKTIQTFTQDTGSPAQTMAFYLAKGSEVIRIIAGGFTANGSLAGRIQFDLLIDNE